MPKKSGCSIQAAYIAVKDFGKAFDVQQLGLLPDISGQKKHSSLLHP